MTRTDRLQKLNNLQKDLLGFGDLKEKLQKITSGVVEIFHADFSRIWMSQLGDLCNSGCMHAKVKKGPNVCRHRDQCLHLLASSGRYTHIDGPHCRMPFGLYKLGRVASGEMNKFLTNNVIKDPQVMNHQWAKELGLVSFAGYKLQDSAGAPLGVLGLFSKQRISPEEDALLEGLAGSAAQVIQSGKSEEILKLQRDRFMSILESMGDGVCISNKENEIEYTNPVLEQEFGPSKGLLCYKYFHNRKDSCPWCKSQKVFEGKIGRSEWRNKKNKKIYDLLDSPLRNINGSISKLSIFRDITDRKRTEDALRNGQKLESLGVLAGGIAHDFNNLLVSILGNADIAMEELSPASPARQYLQDVISGAKRAADLAMQMLAYSGKGTFKLEPVDLTNIVEEITHLLEVSISKSCVIKYHLNHQLPAIMADSIQIQQVIMNLVINASEAIAGKSGVISLTTGAMDANTDYLKKTFKDSELPEGCYVYLEVSDTGCGMNAKTRAKIFDPFFTTKFTGRGLGLAAVMGIIRSHKGALQVYSEPGQGTTFKALFPCCDAALVIPKLKEKKPVEFTSYGIVLVADDEESVRSVAKRMLVKSGFTVITAKDGKTAIEKFKKQPDKIMLVILDMTMPNLNGEEAFREIRLIRPNARVILMSGYNESEATNRFAGKGLAGFIQKPFHKKDLLNKVKEALEKDSFF